MQNYIHPPKLQPMYNHLLDRWFDYNLYPTTIVAEDCVTFKLYNLSEQLVGYQVYNPSKPKTEIGDPREQKYFTWVTKPCASKDAQLAVWGLETISWTDKEIIEALIEFGEKK